MKQKKSENEDVAGLAAWFAWQCEKLTTGREADSHSTGFEALNILEKKSFPAGLLGLPPDQVKAFFESDLTSWLRFAREAEREQGAGVVSYDAAAAFCGASVRTLKRAVAAGEIKTIGKHKPARLDCVSVMRYCYRKTEPSLPREREILILWRLIQTPVESIPYPSNDATGLWPSAYAPDRWERLNGMLAPTKSSPPDILKELLAGYSAPDIALASAMLAVWIRRRDSSPRDQASDPAMAMMKWALVLSHRSKECRCGDIGPFLNDVFMVPGVCPLCHHRGKHLDGRIKLNKNDKSALDRNGGFDIESLKYAAYFVKDGLEYSVYVQDCETTGDVPVSESVYQELRENATELGESIASENIVLDPEDCAWRGNDSESEEKTGIDIAQAEMVCPHCGHNWTDSFEGQNKNFERLNKTLPPDEQVSEDVYDDWKKEMRTQNRNRYGGAYTRLRTSDIARFVGVSPAAISKARKRMESKELPVPLYSVLGIGFQCAMEVYITLKELRHVAPSLVEAILKKSIEEQMEQDKANREALTA